MISTVTNDELGKLNPQQAVDVFRELLWAEANSIGISKNLINVPGAITVGDGGVDAEINARVTAGQGIIKDGLTRYQIKTGRFSITKSSIKALLFIEKKKELKPKIKSCLDLNGTLVFVFFGYDNPDPKDQCRKRFIEALTAVDPKYSNAKIEIWRQNNISSFLEPFISLALKIKRLDHIHYQTHKSWSNDVEMKKEFKLGVAQKDFIVNIQNELRKEGEPIHIRILGEPGIGKTRLVLEATRANDLSPIVIYCESVSKLNDGGLINEILKDDNQFYVILVIDECDFNSMTRVWSRLQDRFRRVKLITIYNEFDEAKGTIKYLDTPPLDNEQICEIFQWYGVSKDQAQRWSEYCSGSPRVAHAFGWSLINTPGDLLKSPDTVNLWDRYIVGGDDSNNPLVHDRGIVLRYMSLFKRFGYGRLFNDETQAILKLIQNDFSHIDMGRMDEIVKKMKSRKILQGEHTLYITPKALHIKLWTEWWDIHGARYTFEQLTSGLPPSLQAWSSEMFKYAEGSEVAQRLVRELLDEKGPFLQ